MIKIQNWGNPMGTGGGATCGCMCACYCNPNCSEPSELQFESASIAASETESNAYLVWQGPPVK